MITIRELKWLLERNGFQIKLKKSDVHEVVHPRLPSNVVLLLGELDAMAEPAQVEVVVHALLRLEPAILVPQVPTCVHSPKRRFPTLLAGVAAGVLSVSVGFKLHIEYTKRTGAQVTAPERGSDGPPRAPEKRKNPTDLARGPKKPRKTTPQKEAETFFAGSVEFNWNETLTPPVDISMDGGQPPMKTEADVWKELQRQKKELQLFNKGGL